MKNYILQAIAIVSVLIPSRAFTQPSDPGELPSDPEVRHGVLENGMTYYVRSNAEPKERASFYIIQNVGAILEEDHQNGLAHYLEHMAFNGTKHFPGKGIINTLERHGVAFGYNINAYTSQDQTVYNISDVPVTKPGLIDTCLLVLNDWSNYLLLTEEEIEAERGVITEEWRTRRTADFRMYRESLPYLYGDSKYATRDVIGDIEVIRNFEPEALRDFYETWYRTDLQAIAVVGDFDAEEVEQKVIDLFSQIPAVENPKERYIVKIPDNDEMIFGMVTDEEATQSRIELYLREYNPERGINDIADLRESYIRGLFNSMTGTRIAELLQKGEPPFVNGSIRRTSLTRDYDLTYVSVSAKSNEGAKALSSIMQEVERIKRYGFAEGELERAKLNMLNRMENRVKEKDKISNDQFAYQYQSHFLNQNTFMDIEDQFQIMKELITTISTADFIQRIPGWFKSTNNVMLVSGPESEEIKHLSESEAKAILAGVKVLDIDPYEDLEVATSLVEEILPSGHIIDEKQISDLDATEWVLSNGAKVIYRFADFEKDNIGIRAYSKGGSSLYDDEAVPSLELLPNMMSMYGLGDYDRITLQKMLTGKTVELNVDLGNLSEGLRGSASPKDFETLMQLVYLRFTKPRFDEEAHKAYIGRYLAFMENMNKNPQKIISDSLTRILSDYHPRARIMNEEYLNDVDMEIIEKAYLERFSDASDFTFFITGNILKEDLVPYIEKYLGSLPSKAGNETWIDHNMDEPEGIVKKEIKLDLEVPKSTIVLVFNKEMDYTPENLVKSEMLRGILDLRFIESIREEEGGTYGVMADASLSHFPDEKGSLFIYFDTDPAKADRLKGLVYDELEKLVNEGPMEKDLSKTAENLLKDREENREYNNYWMNAIRTYYVHGFNPDDPANYDDIVRSISVADIQAFMKELYEDANVVDLVFSPKEKQSE